MPSDDWELHKDTIVCLFLLEKLSLKDVSDRMKEEYHFDQKKHQYEYHLKKWGIKKNLSGDVWRYLSHQVRKRKTLGKRTEIIQFGMQLQPDKVHKEVQRYTSIRTAEDFGRDVPSPTNPGLDLIRVLTPNPPDFHKNWPATLPWLRFLEGFQINLIGVPHMDRLLTQAGSNSIRLELCNPLALCTKINEFVRSIPDLEKGDQYPQSSLSTGHPLEMSTGWLKAILFALSNRQVKRALGGFLHPEKLDEFIIWLFEYILNNSLQWPIDGFGTVCSTTSAISEALFGCAIRQKSYEFISQLLKAGVNPNIPIDTPFRGPRSGRDFEIMRGKIAFWKHHKFCFKANALIFAVEDGDMRLVRILIDAGAELSRPYASFLLERVSSSSMHEDTALELAQLLISHDTGVDIFPALIISIAKHHNHLAMFLAKQASRTTAPEQLVSYRVKTICEKCGSLFNFCYDSGPQHSKINITLLHTAIIAGNTRMAELLLSTTLAYTPLDPNKVWKDLLMVACFAGDRSIIEKLVMLKVDWGGTWPLNISPLVATAWNPDIEIAKMILQYGAFSSHDIANRLPSSETPLPIHVSARSGNADFVRWCIDTLGTSLDVQFIDNTAFLIWHWLVPSKLTSPFQLALESGDTATIKLCQHARLLGGELTQAVRLGDEKLISDLVLMERDITYVDPYGNTVLEEAAKAGNYDIASLYFSSGGEYRSSALLEAVEAALISHDNSVLSLLATHRPPRIIDEYEASAIVLAIQKRQMDLVIILLGDNFLPGSVKSPWSGKVTPLRAAFVSGDTELIERLIQKGYRARPEYLNDVYIEQSIISLYGSHFPPTRDDAEWTRRLLFWSAAANVVGLVRDCIPCVDSLEYYVDLKTPLQRAVEWNKQSSIKLLIDAGADINTPAAAHRGATALQLAAMNGSIDIARLLLERGADVNAPPAKVDGRTALEGASEHGRLDVTQLLLENGVRLDGAMRIHYIRAVAYASQEGHFALATLLKKFGRWTDRDQEVYARKDILLGTAYFVYDEENQDWYFQRVNQKWNPETEDMECYSTSGSSKSFSSTQGSDPEYSLIGEESRCDLDKSENKESGSQDRSAQTPDDELGVIKQEEENDTRIDIPQREDEDMGLLMERYLREDCGYNWDDIRDDEDEAQNPYMEASDFGLEQIIQDQGNNDDNYIPWLQTEDLDMMTVAERYSSLYR